MLLVILTLKKLLEHFTKKNYKKANQKDFIVEKVIKRKGDNYNNSCSSWVDKKDINE